ncbi:hypothetical protein ES703_119942 [subsurface metagenome]
MVRRKVGSYPTSVSDGEQAYFDIGTSFSDTSLEPDTHYFYRAWSWVEGSDIWSDDYAEDDATTPAEPPEPPEPPPPPEAVPEYQKRALVVEGIDVSAAHPLPADIQARYNAKSILDLTPGAPGTFWLPAAGNINLSNFISSSWYIYAPTTATMTINCYLNISHDGGTTWRRAAGYEILDGAFVRDVWNSIHCPLLLSEAKLEVVIGVAAPATLDLMCIRKA